ncbi:DNA polymerase III subunit alpha [Mesoplasma lactucae]|uniref:DNA polymerase III subunit alpha n=1 Tax=Mesoplasma lactucae ATCC 49193 TaxID=81460 RepID=A0A291IRY1_9MOLU|nr:DNA polymerase III subunit alpha [Mesoplasma lactucae]ATG97559.1 DNA polymerase III subunit alpha [Mesoplasma lactucae ATCC 49193]ATZ19982.1 DNA polymerase III subunit alpha [Mesoplasma lactucae ATCC 49193]MCL8217067.1 DNA polymerase III subunit alpha [Mesoplasma lactucae ATCC 49193]
MSYKPQANLRSAYNFQESLITIDDYLDFALKNSFPFSFYADLNSMYGAAEFYDKFSKKNIKPVIGLTLEFHQNQKITLNFYAKNRNGYKNLCYISSEIQTKELNELEILNFARNYFTDDLAYVISFEENHDANLVDALFKDINKENLYYGINFKTQEQYKNFSNVVYTNKIAYFDIVDKKAYNTLLAIKDNAYINEVTTVVDAHYPSEEELYQYAKISNDNLNKIANMVNFDLFEDTGMHLMEYKTPNNIPQRQFLRQLTDDSLNSYFNIYHIPNNKKDDYKKRLDYELNIIEQMGFVNYFLIVRDYVRYAKDNDIMVGPGRGSAAGSLVSFLLRITTVDPLKYNLLFERFLNPERKTMPDIDIDFQDNRREEVIEYLFEKYGVYHVATIVTYQSIGAKSALRDVIRTYNLPVDFANKITKLIPMQYQDDLKGAIKNSRALTSYYNDNKEIFEMAFKLIGLPRQTGTHAAGIVISDVDLRDIVPIRVGYNGIMQTQFDMNYLERLGLIKMDLLGLRNLTTLQEIRSNIFRTEKKDINFDKLDLTDQNVYEQLSLGKTTGIFQLESPGMTNLVMKMNPKNIEDISTTSAIFRPGPKEMIPEYLKRRKSRTKPERYVIDPSLIDILAPTYGIILYQEQVIQVLRKVGGFSLGRADIVRRAMSKKNHEYMKSAKIDFMKGAIANGYSEAKANEIWHWIDNFAAYGFNKSHSIAYSYISYWLAWLKTYYPEQFYTSLFNASLGNAAKTSTYIKEINAYGIDFKGPNIKNVNNKYVAYNKMIFAPLTIISGIGPEFLKKLRNLWVNDKAVFDDFYVLISNLVINGMNRQIFEALAWTGAFDTYQIDRRLIVQNIDSLLIFADQNKGKREIDPLTIPVLESSKEISDQELYLKEYDYLGFYLLNNPFSIKRKEYSNKNVFSLNKIITSSKRGLAILLVDAIRTKKDKNGNLMAFLTLSDDTATIKATMFADTYEKLNGSLNPGAMVLARIRIQNYNGEDSAVVEEIVNYVK